MIVVLLAWHIGRVRDYCRGLDQPSTAIPHTHWCLNRNHDHPHGRLELIPRQVQRRDEILVRRNRNHNDLKEADMVTQLDHVLAEEKPANIVAENSW
jgi:hypothetical protein